MRTLGIEVITRPIEIHRQKIDRIRTILLAVRLALDEQHLLSNPVRGVRFFRIAEPKIIFPKRDRRQLRISAYRTRDDSLLYAEATRVLDKLDTHNCVLVEKLSRLISIGTDPADDSSQMNQDFGTHLRE